MAADIDANSIEPHEEEYQDILRRDGISADSLAKADAFGKASGRDRALEDQSALEAVADRLFTRMMGIPASTQAGRVAKVRAFLAHVGRRDWTGPARDLDWPQEQARALLDEWAGMSADELAAV